MGGLVLGGKLPHIQVRKQSVFLATTMMQVVNFLLSALWDLVAIGIADLVTEHSNVELAASTQKHFDETVQQLTDGRYQISFPWITGCK